MWGANKKVIIKKREKVSKEVTDPREGKNGTHHAQIEVKVGGVERARVKRGLGKRGREDPLLSVELKGGRKNAKTGEGPGTLITTARQHQGWRHSAKRRARIGKS